ncbi:MAG: glycerol-3-phosphate dehydrogenase [Pseudomonadota bacterium]|nr:glycerol-3-phosphate dehydrogenase [Pseudomonadota bacterium]
MSGPADSVVDVAVVGGGINGCGIARDAAGRGLSVALVEMGDLAGATSSASTKLVHGGLRYLEHYEFRLVREALIEREVLLRMAPHIIWPMRFVLPHHKGLRPAWLLRLGLFLYDHIGGRKLLPPTRVLDLRSDPAGAPLKDEYRRAFEYSDCWVDDARLVVLNAMDARRLGADIRTRTRCISARRQDGLWLVETENLRTGARATMKARALVNAAGPWVARFIAEGLGRNASARVRLVKGSHIVVPRLFDHERSYFFQNGDGRIFFAIPWQDDFTLIGTTDVDVGDDPAAARISEDEVTYLCAAASEYFRRPVRREDVVHTYSGVRPLYDDGTPEAKAATRDYVLDLDQPKGEAPVLHVFGGKITTYRRLAEAALAKLEPYLKPVRGDWTAGTCLPGGDFAVDGFEALVARLQALAPDREARTVRRLARSHGTAASAILGAAQGADFGAGLTAAECGYLVENEWALTADDILWRRTKLGLRVTPEGRAALEAWLAERTA